MGTECLPQVVAAVGGQAPEVAGDSDEGGKAQASNGDEGGLCFSTAAATRAPASASVRGRDGCGLRAQGGDRGDDGDNGHRQAQPAVDAEVGGVLGEAPVLKACIQPPQPSGHNRTERTQHQAEPHRIACRAKVPSRAGAHQQPRDDQERDREVDNNRVEATEEAAGAREDGGGGGLRIWDCGLRIRGGGGARSVTLWRASRCGERCQVDQVLLRVGPELRLALGAAEVDPLALVVLENVVLDRLAGHDGAGGVGRGCGLCQGGCEAQEQRGKAANSHWSFRPCGVTGTGYHGGPPTRGDYVPPPPPAPYRIYVWGGPMLMPMLGR